MPTPLEEGIATIGVPRHYTHSYERCRTPHPLLALPIPMRWGVSAGDATPHAIFVAWREAPVSTIPTRPVGLSQAVAAKVLDVVMGEALPRSLDAVAACIIVGIADWGGFNCVGEDGITKTKNQQKMDCGCVMGCATGCAMGHETRN